MIFRSFGNPSGKSSDVSSPLSGVGAASRPGKSLRMGTHKLGRGRGGSPSPLADDPQHQKSSRDVRKTMRREEKLLKEQMTIDMFMEQERLKAVERTKERERQRQEERLGDAAIRHCRVRNLRNFQSKVNRKVNWG